MSTINVCANGAVADNGATDNTTAFQTTINQVASAGGGNVFVPDSGSSRYDFNGAITLLPGVNLVGESTKNSFVRAQGNTQGTPRGSILGAKSQSAKFITVSASGNSIRGLTFFYPQQNETASPIPYPATIGQPLTGTVNDVSIEECVFLNAYDGIEMKTVEMGGLWINGIKGDFLHHSIDIDRQDDWVYISDVFDHPALWSVQPGIVSFQKSQGIGLQIGSAIVQADTIVVDGKALFINLVAGVNGGAPAGYFKNIGNDDCVDAIRVQATANGGVTIDGWVCACTSTGSALAFVGPDARVTVQKALIWGTYGWTIINVAGGYLGLMDSILQPSANYGSLALDNCAARVRGNRFESVGVSGSVSVGRAMSYWHWDDNETHGPISIPPNT